MKKFLLTAAMGVLFFIGLSSMASSAADPYPNCQEDCAFLVEFGVFPSHGACMSACHTCTEPGGETTYAVCLCKFVRDVYGGFEANGFKNMGECVTTVKGN